MFINTISKNRRAGMGIKSKALRRIVSIVALFTLLFQQLGFAQMAVELNLASHFAQLQGSFTADKLRLPHLRYLSYDNNADSIRIFLDKGDIKDAKDESLRDSAQLLLKYFLIGVTLPDENFWVNLRPDSSENIISGLLEETDIGKIFLEADVQLKKDTAQFTSPQTKEGKAYWDKLYQKAYELYGSENVTIPTLTRPWIVPDEIIIRQSADSAYIYKANLKVMLEQDYLKGSVEYSFADERAKQLNEYSSQLIRELILPQLTKEVNNAKRYANLRQVYYSLILARWFKTNFSGKSGLYSSYINKQDLNGLASVQPWSKNTYFKQYQDSFKNGEYNLKVPVNTLSGASIRSYFSGGIELGIGKIGFSAQSSSPVAAFTGSSNLLPIVAVNAGMIPFAVTAANPILLTPGIVSLPTVASSPVALSKEEKERIYHWRGVILTAYSDYPHAALGLGNFFSYEVREIRKIIKSNHGALNYLPRYLLKYFKKGEKDTKIKENTIPPKILKITNFIGDLNRDKYLAQDIRGIKYEIMQEARTRTGKKIDIGSVRDIFKRLLDEKYDRVIKSRLDSEKNNEGRTVGVGSEEGTDMRELEGGVRVGYDVSYWSKGSRTKYVEYALRQLGEFVKDGDIYTNYILMQAIKALIYKLDVGFEDNGNGGLELTAIPASFETWHDLLALIKDSAAYRKSKASELSLASGSTAASSQVKSASSPVTKEEAFTVLKSLTDKSRLAEQIISQINSGALKDKDSFLAYLEGLYKVQEKDPALYRNLPLSKVAPMARGFLESLSGNQPANPIIREFLEAVVKGSALDLDDHTIALAALYFATPAASSPETASSPVETVVPDKKGGIDFRALPMTIQPIGSFQGLNLSLSESASLAQININDELSQIKKMVDGGILPSGDRVKELVAVCYHKSELANHAEELMLCLIRICKLQEDMVMPADNSLKEAIVIVDSF
jgi:hypothetical protein